MAWINLLDETLNTLKEKGHTERDVVVVMTTNKNHKWEAFKKAAKDFVYENGFGVPEVRTDLKIVGTTWWLERWEYDGAEGWAYKERPWVGFDWSDEIELEEDKRIDEVFGK